MSNIDKIRQEIERRKKICEDIFERESDTYYQGKAVAYGELLPFIDSLPDEPVSNDLEEAAETFCDTLEGKEAWSYGPAHYDWGDVNNAFIAGAEWMAKQKEQEPAEWSEENEDMLNSCISSIEEAKENRYAYKETDGDTSYDHEIDWLKSLRPQQKVEWSEEDKDKVVQYLHDRDGGMLWSKATDITRDILDMLRP